MPSVRMVARWLATSENVRWFGSGLVGCWRIPSMYEMSSRSLTFGGLLGFISMTVIMRKSLCALG